MSILDNSTTIEQIDPFAPIGQRDLSLLPLLDNSTTTEQILSSNLEQISDNEICIKGNRCNRSDCFICQYRKGCQKQKEILQNISDRKLYRVVLTLRTSNNLSAIASKLYEDMKSFRRSEWFKRKIRGGYQRLHIDNHNNGWQPHFDCLIELQEGQSITHRELSEQWEKQTGDSFVVRIQRVGETELDNYRLTRYQLKPSFKQISNSPELMKQYLSATKGRRKFQRFGEWTNTATRKAWKKLPKQSG